jgi:SAM-dependent methyltransferase
VGCFVTIERKQAQVFGEVAERYHRVRAPYPASLFEQIVELTTLPDSGKVVDIGSGTGLSSGWFVDRGHDVIGIEPDTAMAAVAERELGATGRFVVAPTVLEEWSPPPEGFDLAVSGQAWHWADPDSRFADVAAALRPRAGWLAVYWNRPVLGGLAFESELDAVYQDVLGIAGQGKGPAPLALRFPGAKAAISASDPAQEFEQSGLFGPVARISINWKRRLTTELHIENLLTQSDHRLLPNNDRNVLLAAVSQVIESHGGVYELPIHTHGYVARVAS